MLSFDIDKEAFIKLTFGLKNPCLIQLLARVDPKCFTCSPLELYNNLRNAENSGPIHYSYLLESVEKQAARARYSFVGNNPDCLVKISDRIVSLRLLNPKASALFKTIRCKLEEVCGPELIKKEKGIKENIENRTELENPEEFTVIIPEGKDAFDALHMVFPPANGVELKNASFFERQTFLGGAIGYTAYDAIYDSWLGVHKGFESEIPELQYLLVSKTFVFDHLTEDLYIVVTPFVDLDSSPEKIYEESLSEAEKLYSCLGESVKLESTKKDSKYSSESSFPLNEIERKVSQSFPAFSDPSEMLCNSDRKDFEAAVLQTKEHILAGDIFQAVLSRKCEFTLEKIPFELYLQLREINPSPYMYIFEFEELAIVGASPETLMTVHKRTVITNPIAGTCPRGKSETEDEFFASHMLQDEKERAEHVMLVDLGRNDVRMVAESGSVKVSEFMKVLKYSHVQHIESTVSGRLRPECDQFDAFRAIFPAGTLSGAPKIRAMEIISELENSPRGIYGGGVGYYSWNGDADFAIVIRTMLIKGKKAIVQAGAGIVADSNPEYEFKETERKMAAMLTAISGEI
ncbi:MAG: anthranilate synthase component I [Methanosarcina sp.]